MESNLIKVSNLLNTMGILAHAVNSGIKPTVDHNTHRVMECVLTIVEDIPNRSSWRSLTTPQEVFIKPEAVHAFIKLTSTVSQFIAAQYHNDIHLTTASVVMITEYLNKIRELHKLKPIALTPQLT